MSRSSYSTVLRVPRGVGHWLSRGGQGLLLLAAALIAFTPGGGAICWPLLDGQRLHIGWSMHAGHPTDTPTVYMHAAAEPPRPAAGSILAEPRLPGALPAPTQWLPLAGALAAWLAVPAGLWRVVGEPPLTAGQPIRRVEPPPPRPA